MHYRKVYLFQITAPLIADRKDSNNTRSPQRTGSYGTTETTVSGSTCRSTDGHGRTANATAWRATGIVSTTKHAGGLWNGDRRLWACGRRGFEALSLAVSRVCMAIDHEMCCILSRIYTLYLDILTRPTTSLFDTIARNANRHKLPWR
jgi:hypothetical protein